MSAFPGSPRILKGGLVLLDPDTFVVLPNGDQPEVPDLNPNTVQSGIFANGLLPEGQAYA